MIIELALLRLPPGSAPAFECAFASVAPLLAGADGCLRYRLVPALEPMLLGEPVVMHFPVGEPS